MRYTRLSDRDRATFTCDSPESQMFLWVSALALAEPAPPAIFEARPSSLGDSPLRFVLRDTHDGNAVVELRWEAFDRVTIEAVVEVRAGCDGAVLATGRSRVGAGCRSIDRIVKDPHPIYDDVADTRLRCVLGTEPDGAPVAWCKLDYTDWFAARPPSR